MSTSQCPERIKAAVQRMGVPTRAEIEMLASRVEALGRELDEIEKGRRLPAQDTRAAKAGARGVKKRRPTKSASLVQTTSSKVPLSGV